jgi:hypothetical protein
MKNLMRRTITNMNGIKNNDILLISCLFVLTLKNICPALTSIHFDFANKTD